MTWKFHELVPHKPDSPSQKIAHDGLILRVLVGSGVHGTAVDGQDDIDEMGVCWEPPETVVGLDQFKHYTFRTQPEGEPSGPGDLDFVVYSLRRYLGLVSSGNPTTLLPLFVPDQHVGFINHAGIELRENAERLISKRAGARFKGYLLSQRKGLTGEKTGAHNAGRMHIVEKYGYDCYLDDTEFLTRRGWRLYDEIADGEEVGTVNPVTGVIEFQIPTERVAKQYSGPIHFIRHRYSSCAVTPNHRMWTSPVNRGPSGSFGTQYRREFAAWGFRPVDSLAKHHHIRVAGEPSLNDFPISDVDLTLLGCYLSEGTVAKRLSNGAASVLSFTQKVGGRQESLLATVSEVFPMRSFTYTRTDGGRSRPCTYTTYTLADRAIAARIAKECGEGSANLHLPEWAFQLSSRQAKLLLTALMAGDGTTCRTGYQVYYSTSRRLAGDVQALALIAGYRSNMWGPYEQGIKGVEGIYQVLVHNLDRKIEALSVRNNVRIESVDGRIVCFTVPNEILVTRREGRVAMQGNTKYAMHAYRLGVQGIELMLTGRITLPLNGEWLTTARSIRQGEKSFDEVLTLIDQIDDDLSGAIAVSPLPGEPDRAWINEFLYRTHQWYWDNKEKK